MPLQVKSLMNRASAVLFVAALFLLPAADWRLIVLPVGGKSWAVDMTGRGSASLFDVVFLFFCLTLAPAIWSFCRSRRLLSFKLTHWYAGAALLLLLLATNEHALPYLTPTIRKVVDARSLLLHMAVMIATAVYVSRLHHTTVIRGTFAFCVLAAVGLAFLSALALNSFPYFFYHYPFANPTTIAFPFPNSSMAGTFIALACIALAGSAMSLRRGSTFILFLPVFILAVALTGSRSSLLALTGALAVLAALTLGAVLRRQRMNLPQKTGWYAAAGAILAATLVTGGYDWQPVQRALSIFSEVARSPGDLLKGGAPGSPRREMWRLATSGEDLSKYDDNLGYGVLLTTISDGCVAHSSAVQGLEVGRTYWIRLTQRPNSSSSQALLQVYADAERKRQIGAVSAKVDVSALPYLYQFLADSGAHYTTRAGELSNFRVKIDGRPLIDSDGVDAQGVTYFDPLNGAPGAPVTIHEDRVRISALSRKIKGFVGWPGKIPAPRRELMLEFSVYLDRVTAMLPPESPAMFYVGLHDNDIDVDTGSWARVRNAILVQHRREALDWEPYLHALREMQEIVRQFPNHRPETRRAIHERMIETRDCDESGGYAVSDLWKAGEKYDLRKFSYEKLFTGGVAVERDLSIVKDNRWDAREYLKRGGSTHNAYLDWYYYEGLAALGLFAIFILSLAAATVRLAWITRNSESGSFHLAIATQIVLVGAVLYVQPIVWGKFVWILFGIASGLLIHDELRSKRSVSSSARLRS